MQQGTHEELMTDASGPYWALATAQQLSVVSKSIPIGNSSTENHRADLVEEEEFIREPEIVEISKPFDKFPRDSRPFLGSFGLFLREQHLQKRWYLLMLVSAIGAGSMFSLSTLNS